MRTITERLVFLLTFVGFFLRIRDISGPFWIDEVLLIEHLSRQEFLPIFIVRGLHSLGLTSEVFTRLPFILAGTLTIPAIFWVIEDKRYAFIAAIYVTFAPLLVFWSGFARPYVMAGLFMTLGWRWPWFYILAFLCTPVSLIGINLYKIKKRWVWYLVLAVFAIISFLYRPDTGRGFFGTLIPGFKANLDYYWNWSFFYEAKRLWYIPLLSFALHLPRFCRGRQRVC